MNRNQYITLIFAALFIFGMTGCKEDCEETICFDVPNTYTFDNVSYSGQTDRLNMLEEMTTYMKTANTSGVALDANTLKSMFSNEGDVFSFTSTKQLKNKCFSLDQDMFEGYMDAIAVASQSTVPGSDGVAGVVSSNDGSKSYLFDENGIEHIQLIEKGLMGAVFYYQATAVYLSEDRIGDAVDNTNITPGEGTEMEHHWDEAFGYFGVPTDFPTNTTGVRFHGKYCNSRDALMGTNQSLMDAFILGRAAISNSDMAVKDEQVVAIRDTWELVIAGTAIHYLNGGRADLADDALRNHQLSEAIAFAQSLKYNPTKKITDAQIEEVLNLIGTNLYAASASNLLQARDLLSSIYGLDNVKEQL